MRTNDLEEQKSTSYNLVPVSRITCCHIPLGHTSKFKCHSGAFYRVIPSHAYTGLLKMIVVALTTSHTQ